MKTDYKALDAAILAAISQFGSGATFLAISTHCDKEAREALRHRPRSVQFRGVDRRLQALRKAGKIKHASGYWSLA